jgi:hypothetical protein
VGFIIEVFTEGNIVNQLENGKKETGRKLFSQGGGRQARPKARVNLRQRGEKDF